MDDDLIKHKAYLEKKDFVIKIPLHFFKKEEVEDLKDNGTWYQGLDSGELKPRTDTQFAFVSCSKGNKNISIEQGTVWLKYKKLRKEWGVIYDILHQCDQQELMTLSKIIDSKYANPDSIITTLIRKSQNLYQNLQQQIAYVDVVKKVCRKKKINPEHNTLRENEIQIATNVLKAKLSKMDDKQKAEFEKEVRKIADSSGYGNLFKTGSVFATLLTAKLSGFGVYLLATTTLSTLSGIIGATLPFAAYTMLTSSLAVTLGPAGWGAAGVFSIWKITDVDYKRVTPAIIYINLLREKYT